MSASAFYSTQHDDSIQETGPNSKVLDHQYYNYAQGYPISLKRREWRPRHPLEAQEQTLQYTAWMTLEPSEGAPGTNPHNCFNATESEKSFVRFNSPLLPQQESLEISDPILPVATIDPQDTWSTWPLHPTAPPQGNDNEGEHYTYMILPEPV